MPSSASPARPPPRPQPQPLRARPGNGGWPGRPPLRPPRSGVSPHRRSTARRPGRHRSRRPRPARRCHRAHSGPQGLSPARTRPAPDRRRAKPAPGRPGGSPRGAGSVLRGAAPGNQGLAAQGLAAHQEIRPAPRRAFPAWPLELDGNLVITPDRVIAWYRLPLQRWTFRPEDERLAVVAASAAAGAADPPPLPPPCHLPAVRGRPGPRPSTGRSAARTRPLAGPGR